MSKGPGRIQRELLALMATEAGPRSIEQLCGLLYPGYLKPTRAQLGTVHRALERMALPGTWTTGRIRPDRRQWLYDASRTRWTDLSVHLTVADLSDTSTEIMLSGAPPQD